MLARWEPLLRNTAPERTPTAATVHVHDAFAVTTAPWWVVVLAFGFAFLLLGGAAVFVIVVTRLAIKPVVPPPLPPTHRRD